MIGEAELRAMPTDAVLVNVGRGSLVQPAPLQRALQDGELHGYASDVWWRYPKTYSEIPCTTPWDGTPRAHRTWQPPPPRCRSRLPLATDSPAAAADEEHSLATLDQNVVLSPHRGGGVGLQAVETVTAAGAHVARHPAMPS
jgi:lactate dehydrogenase-like 2-hydroxyacid dehydrogenase